MRYELVQLSRYETCDNPIDLDDYSNNSYAVYRANNPLGREFIYFRPDEERKGEPRCDYILTEKAKPAIASRFIELKGDNLPRQGRCCRTEWDHAFHQLVCTYMEFADYIDRNEERAIFILCTSIEEKRVAARFRNYRWYKQLRESISEEIVILYKPDYDIL